MISVLYAKVPLPIFNTKEAADQLGKNTLTFSDEGLWKLLETVLLPGTPIRVEAPQEGGVCEISTPAYLSRTPLYTIYALTQKKNGEIHNKKRVELPSLDSFLSRLESCVEQRIPYLWGGNLPGGTSALTKFFPLTEGENPQISQVKELRGVDCSGLIYWAAQGAIGRNSSDLIRAGTAVEIAQLCPSEITQALEPGMIIGWQGHVLVVTKYSIIESTPKTGVVAWPLQEKVKALVKVRAPLDAWPSKPPPVESFVVRRLFNA